MKQTKHDTKVPQPTKNEAKLTLSALRSPTDITTGDLARTVGITQGAVFRHFSSKEAIWLAVLEWASDTLIAQLQAAAEQVASTVGQEPNPLAALQAVFIAHLHFVMAYPAVPRIIFHELQQAQDTPRKACVRALMQQYHLLVASLLQQAQAKRLLAPRTDVQAAAVLFVGSIQGLVMQSLTSGQVNAIAAQGPSVFALYLRGLTLKEAP